MRLSFEIVSYYANQLFDKAANAKSLEEKEFYLSAYDNYLRFAGWSSEELDLCLLAKIDSNWVLGN